MDTTTLRYPGMFESGKKKFNNEHGSKSCDFFESSEI